MDALYWVPKRSSGPQPPPHWSYTSLKQFSDCPRKWCLANSNFDELNGGKIPNVPNPSQITGRIVHGMLDSLERFREMFCADGDSLCTAELDELLSKFGVRKRARELLVNEKAGLNKNLRCKPDKILGQISLDDCVAQFKRVVVNRYPHGPCKTVSRKASVKTSGRTAMRSVGAEIELSHNDPPLIGYVDYVGDGKIVEVKTGKFAEEHLAQAKFYALLYKYQFGAPPSLVSVEYASASEQSFTQQIDPEELVALDREVRETIQNAHNQIEDHEFKAIPSAENCRHCHVRFACEDYWRSEQTKSLRLSLGSVRAFEFGGSAKQVYLDTELQELPSNWEPSTSMTGEVQFNDDVTVNLRIGASLCPKNDEVKPARARILNAEIRLEETGMTIGTTSASEVFWLAVMDRR